MQRIIQLIIVKGGVKLRRVAAQNRGTPALFTPCDPAGGAKIEIP